MKTIDADEQELARPRPGLPMRIITSAVKGQGVEEVEARKRSNEDLFQGFDAGQFWWASRNCPGLRKEMKTSFEPLLPHVRRMRFSK